MKKLVLIGGGTIGINNTNYTTKKIDRKIVELTNKPNPNLLFIGFASTSAESYFKTIKNNFAALGCQCQILKRKNLINNYELAINKIKNSDIIYIGGGDTIKLKEEILEFRLENELNEAINRGCVIAGISAGGILLSKDGFSDSLKLRKKSDKYTFIDGLNILKISFCPHYNNQEKKEELRDNINNKKVYSLEDNTALIILNNKEQIIKSNINNKAYICYYKNNKFVEEEIYE